MRLIDADKLKYYGNHIGDEYEDRFHDFQYVDRDQIDKAPSIEIISCRECKMWMSEHLCQWWSRYGTVETDADDFCSYGERSE